MQLKDYQVSALSQIRRYLELLDKEKSEGNIKHASADAWRDLELRKSFQECRNGMNQDLPNFCLKIPTGGGKTLMAVKAIDLINTVYRKKQTGLILWVVPTNQIYTQTIKALRDRNHPYREHLDIASGGRTLVLEKTDRFTPLDVEENLAVLILMLPSANRKSKETLKVFKDNGGFQGFFPAEDKIKDQEELLKRVPNLDYYGDTDNFWGKQVKTSLGNTLRLLSPVIILDEGHKAYSEGAQDTLRGFNPSLILELSATPTDQSNVLVDIQGRELEKEDMIKLDLHLINKSSPDWHATLLACVEKRNLLENKAQDYDANTDNYIRPVCLIQVERTGKEQRGGKFIHSEDAREYLIKTVGIPADQVKVTSAELKEIEGINLLARDCSIRYIITNKALQEGWDCSFAYLLAVLTNPSSKNSLTQLIGRILRQPYAVKTGIRELDESYVFTFQQKAANLIKSIRDGFEGEGLGDLSSRVISDADNGDESQEQEEKTAFMRAKFKKAAGQVVLPIFIVKDEGSWRKVNYDMDIASRIDWSQSDLSPILNLNLSSQEEGNIDVAIGFSSDAEQLIEEKRVLNIKEGGFKVDSTFVVRHLIDIVSNPWISHQLADRILEKLVKKHGEKLVTDNFVFIIEEIRKLMLKEKDRLAKDEFDRLIAKGILRFMVISKDLGFDFKSSVKVKATAKTLTKSDGQPLQRSLFDFVPEDDMNETEKAVAWYFEDQDKMFFWYRNIARQDYAIQGWRKQKIYPDFIFTETEGNQENINKVFVVETKGIHLKNEDTDYKQSVFNLCNKYAAQKNLDQLALAMKDKSIRFEVIFEDEWKNRINELLR